jgi:cyanate permease
MIVQDYFGLKSFASIMGVAGYGTALSFAIGPIVTGISMDELGNYDPIFYGTVALLLMGIVALAAMGNPTIRQQE